MQVRQCQFALSSLPNTSSPNEVRLGSGSPNRAKLGELALGKLLIGKLAFGKRSEYRLVLEKESYHKKDMYTRGAVAHFHGNRRVVGSNLSLALAAPSGNLRSHVVTKILS